jgi:dynein assembly factor 3
MSAETVAKSIGHHGHWGFSAGFDFLEALPGALSVQSTSPTEVNILLVNPGDIRHILFSISRRRRHKSNSGELPRINFYLLETPVELLSRELLLLQVLTDFEVPIRQRANVYLEIFGNVKVQKRTSKYMELLGKQLKQLSAKGVGRLDQLVDFSMLNYRERDQFEQCLDGYAHAFVFEMGALYDQRQRGLYAERFDARKGLSDWDYQAGVKTKASIVHSKQYREWRNTGIAFEFGDQTYSEPNRSLMTYTEGFMKKGKEKGMKKEVKGFWGDIVSSPYFAIGIDSDTPNKFAEGLYEIINKVRILYRVPCLVCLVSRVYCLFYCILCLVSRVLCFHCKPTVVIIVLTPRRSKHTLLTIYNIQHRTRARSSTGTTRWRSHCTTCTPFCGRSRQVLCTR